MEPIFFAWTRSFWLTVSGIALQLFGAPPEVLHSIGLILSWVLPWPAEQIGDTLVRVGPAILWGLALQQRAGSARPYTIDPRARQ